MDLFLSSCLAAAEFPKNLTHHNTYPHNLKAYFERLNKQEDRLFSEESKAAVDFWENGENSEDSRQACIRNADELQKHLHYGSHFGHDDPLSRYVFIHAPHSRERLKITRRMLVITLTYHQVMPAFLDFIFPFGRQQYPQDFHFGAFNHEECITEHDRGPQIPELKRSGYGFQMCYNLRSVEPSKNHEEWPWSIRQTAIYHSFDLDTLRATWIIIKGNQLMKKRITATTGVDDPSTLATLDTVGPVAALERTLATQLILCDWSGENWRWFINFLEEALQNATRHTLSVTVDKPPKKSPNAIKEKKALRTTRRTFSHFNRIFSSPISEKSQCETPDVLISPASTFPPWTPDSRNYPAEEEEKHEPDEVELPTFSFRDLQRIQFIEEKTNETLLVLKVNLNVLAELKEHYSSIGSQIYTYNEDCSGIVARFIKRISSIEKDVRMQLSRVKTLLRLLADRKNLLYGILQYQSMEASKLLAEKSQHSTDNMEDMTKGMHKIAQKTQQETVSMRIITLVTLFFLPGTFISTLMSTDIFKFETGNSGKTQKFVQTGALQLFMSITIPLMVLTFGAWYGVYWWVNHREKKKGRVNSAFISRV